MHQPPDSPAPFEAGDGDDAQDGMTGAFDQLALNQDQGDEGQFQVNLQQQHTRADSPSDSTIVPTEYYRNQYYQPTQHSPETIAGAGYHQPAGGYENDRADFLTGQGHLSEQATGGDVHGTGSWWLPNTASASNASAHQQPYLNGPDPADSADQYQQLQPHEQQLQQEGLTKEQRLHMAWMRKKLRRIEKRYDNASRRREDDDEGFNSYATAWKTNNPRYRKHHKA